MAERILVVDDDKGVREALSEFLVSLGYEVSQVESGEEALREYRKREFDVIMAENAHVASIGVLTGTDTEASLKLGAEKVTILESVSDLPMYLKSGKAKQCL